MFSLFPSQFLPCPACGASCERVLLDDHVCDPERYADFQLFELRDEVARLESAISAYFESARGRFEVWYAERERRRR